MNTLALLLALAAPAPFLERPRLGPGVYSGTWAGHAIRLDLLPCGRFTGVESYGNSPSPYERRWSLEGRRLKFTFPGSPYVFRIWREGRAWKAMESRDGNTPTTPRVSLERVR